RLEAVAERYAVAVTADLVALIDKAVPDDPIARQFIPDARELDTRPEERGDPIGDGRFTPMKGIVHRYPDRVLLKPLLACPVYCRFCFRREMVGPGGEALDAAELEAALDYIRRTPAVWEVIVTGGDPLMLAPRRIAAIVEALDAIDQVKIVRWHSRVPVVDPSRVTEELVAALSVGRKPAWLALHSNHPRELTADAGAAIARLRRAGVNLVSQTVLLKGVNDDAEVLAELMRRFVENGVKPYYLHHADLAPGTSHFRTSIAEGQALMKALRGRLSGLAQPTYVIDIPGGYGKVPAGAAAVGDVLGETIVADPSGERHVYPPRALES
ncbi:MAG: lysine-2,3-aminomutase-like protein, partial [Bauldia sp.]